MSLADLALALRTSRGFAHKRDIGDVLGTLAASLPGGTDDLAQAVAVGDDCAAIPLGDGSYLLFAIEGFVDDFVAQMPWFAGYSGVMVNVSDVYAMGGRPLAVVDALWSAGADDAVLQGLAAASQRYAVPIVGGHSNRRSDRAGLAVAIIGRAKRLMTSFDARPGDALVMAIDLRGAFEEPQPFWNASTQAPAERLRADLEVLARLAEDGLCRAAKDISMAGAIGTALMLLEGSKVGAVIDVDAVPRPGGVPLERWLQAFPSYGFVLAVDPADLNAVRDRFAAREIASAVVGEVTAARQLWLRRGDERVRLWNLDDESFIAERPAEAPRG